MDLIMQGLTLSLTGIVITFASLGLFILIIVLLQRFFGIQEEPKTSEARTGPASLPESMDNEMDHEVAAAIAIAIDHFRSLESGSDGIGTSLAQGPGPWWSTRQFPAIPQRKAK